MAMDLSAHPNAYEKHVLGNISHFHEFNEWISDRIRMRITRTVPGGFGTVYCLYKATSGERFARKVFEHVGVRGGITNSDIANEVRTMSSFLRPSIHNHVVELLGHGSIGEFTASYYIDMEHCDLNLEEYINNNVTVPSLVSYETYREAKELEFFFCAFIQEILSGLMFIHGHGKVHRDLKPRNILYSAQKGWWKIADFGITSEAHTSQLLTTTEARGSNGYRAPELLREEKHFGQVSDVWSLGCVLYELLTGSRPFKTDYIVQQLQSSEDLSFSFLPELGDSFTSAAQGWLKGMLQVDPTKRPSIKMLASRYGALLCAAFPNAKEIDMTLPNADEWILGTDGPLPFRVIRWDDVFVPGIYTQRTAAISRYEKIYRNRAIVLGCDPHGNKAVLWSAMRLAWAYVHRLMYKKADQLFRTIMTYDNYGPEPAQAILAIKTGVARCQFDLVQTKPLKSSERMFQEITEAQFKLLGSEHEDTLYSRERLAWTWFHWGDEDAAYRALLEVTRIRMETLGTHHSDTLNGKALIGWFHWWKEDYDIAETQFTDVFLESKASLGLGHPCTAKALAGWSWCEGNAELLKYALTVSERVLGPISVYTHGSSIRLAELLKLRQAIAQYTY